MIVLYFLIVMAIIIFLPFFVGKLLFKNYEENIILLWCYGGMFIAILAGTTAIAIHASMAFSNFLNK